MAPSLDDVARTRIKSWLVSRNTTQTALAERIGKNQAWMSRYLSREFDADLETLNKMANVFGHSLYALFDAPADPEEAALIECFRAMAPDARALMLSLGNKLARGLPRARGK